MTGEVMTPQVICDVKYSSRCIECSRQFGNEADTIYYSDTCDGSRAKACLHIYETTAKWAIWPVG